VLPDKITFHTPIIWIYCMNLNIATVCKYIVYRKISTYLLHN